MDQLPALATELSMGPKTRVLGAGIRLGSLDDAPLTRLYAVVCATACLLDQP